jgi:hypothetical protein
MTEMGKAFFEVGAIVCDDAVRVAILINEFLQELSHCGRVKRPDWLSFNPLGELVHCYEQMSKSSSSPFERTNHIYSPNGKQPGDRYSLQCRTRHLRLACILLASNALVDDLFGINMCSKPEESVAKSFVN